MATKNVLVHPDPIQAVTVTVDADVEKGQAWTANGFVGVIKADGESGEDVPLDVSSRTWQMNIGSLTLSKGDLIYVDSSGNLTDDSGETKFGRLVTDKDSNDVADILVLPQV